MKKSMQSNTTQPNERKKGLSSIQAKMLIFILCPMFIIFGMVGVIVTTLVSNNTTQFVETQVSNEASIAKEKVNEFFSKYITLVSQENYNMTFQEYFKSVRKYSDRTTGKYYKKVMETLDQILADNSENLANTWVADTQANVIFHCSKSGWVGDQTWTANDRPWYQTAVVEQKAFIVDPYTSAAIGQTIISIISPVIDQATGETLGVFGADLNIESLPDIMKNLGSSSKNGYTVLLASNGTVVYHPNEEYKLVNFSETEYTDDVKNVVSKKTEGKLNFKYDGQSYTGNLSTVPSCGWMVLTQFPQSEINSKVTTVRNSVFLMLIGSMLIFAIVVVIISTTISRPIKKITAAAKEIADGNFNVELKINSKDEIGTLSQTLNLTIDQLQNYQGYIDEISETLEKMENGDMNVELKRDYAGQFAKLKTSLYNFIEKTCEILSNINQAAEQVANGSEQVASGAQSLSQGATEQAASIEELSSAINEISEHIQNIAANAQTANGMSGEAVEAVRRSNKKMEEMIEAMRDISDKSNQISNIIKTIDDIAFQTNILALNAAVEAARAGDAGKGFAVVADEVRNLAGKSAEAAKNTTLLIGGTVEAVEKGTQIVNETAKYLEDVVEKDRIVYEKIEHIAEATNDQATSIAQVTQGIEQISSVVQTTSATAEESAAASEELSSQANVMKNLVEQFNLR